MTAVNSSNVSREVVSLFTNNGSKCFNFKGRSIKAYTGFWGWLTNLFGRTIRLQGAMTAEGQTIYLNKQHLSQVGVSWEREEPSNCVGRFLCKLCPDTGATIEKHTLDKSTETYLKELLFYFLDKPVQLAQAMQDSGGDSYVIPLVESELPVDTDPVMVGREMKQALSAFNLFQGKEEAIQSMMSEDVLDILRGTDAENVQERLQHADVEFTTKLEGILDEINENVLVLVLNLVENYNLAPIVFEHSIKADGAQHTEQYMLFLQMLAIMKNNDDVSEMLGCEF